MLRALGPFAVVACAAVARADGPPDVAALVKQLGDPKFAVREAAQKELEKRGEGVVPELDRLVKTADAETAERIGKVRYKLVGYKDDIRQCILRVKMGRGLFDPIPGELTLPADLRYLIADHQPGAGDLLLDLAANEKGQFWYETRHLFVQAWDVMTADQLDRYIRQTVRLETRHRAKFPAGVPAMISFEAGLRHDWAGLPNPVPKGFVFRQRTTRYLDGKPYEKPFEYAGPRATVGWYHLGKLAEGKHTIHAVMEYEFTQNGQKRKGEIRSKESTFEIVAADTPDDLIAPKSEARDKEVRSAFVVSETDDNAFLPSAGPAATGIVKADPWYPQCGWFVNEKELWMGLHVPRWRVSEKLDVDLYFDVQVHDLKTGKRFPGGSLVLRRGETGSGFLGPDDVKAYCADRDGFVTVKIILTPSRAAALSDPKATGYFPGEITTPELRMKVYPRSESKNHSK